MILYKHGVGFFRREGEFDAEEVTLTFRHDEINDVLKSLAAFDRQGGQILGIHYQTPMDKAARLDDSSIRLSDQSSLFDLLRDLRGRQVTLLLAEESIQGRLIGVDRATGVEAEPGDSLVSLASEQDIVRVFQIASVRGVQIHDDRAEHDLHFFLDTSMSEDLRRTVTLRLSPGHHQLVVYYVAPSPTWRVSYRVIAESEDGKQSGDALLQGWGLFDNRLDEDLKDVAVTLVAGQPISFIYDLYASRIPDRPIVQDEARIAPGPVEFRAEAPAGRQKRRGPALMAAAAMASPAPAALDESDMRLGGMPAREEMLASTTPSAEGREAGEFFQYVVTTPVSVKRGDSALVPILGTDVAYRKELLYNGSKLPEHPVAAIRFENTTGLTLERGPVTVVEDGEYKGEAVVPFTKDGRDVYLPYAVELGVRVVERPQHHTEMAGLHIHERFLFIEEYNIHTVKYTIDNTTGQDKTITVEAPITTGYELFETPEPDVTTPEEQRWRVEVPAQSTVDFTRRERSRSRRHEEVRRLDYRRLQNYLEGRWLDQATFNQLSDVLDSLGFIQTARQEQARLDAERKTIHEREGQLRENLNTLKGTGEEGQLRNRMLRQLEASENRLEEIAARHAELGAADR
jgi:hypothetical protein